MSDSNFAVFPKTTVFSDKSKVTRNYNILNMKKGTLILSCFLLTFMAACSGGSDKNANLPRVKTDTVKLAAGSEILQYPGKVKAADEAALSFRVSGPIVEICVEDGARVRKGQLLARLDPTDYEIQLAATEAEYNQVKSEAERVMALYKDGGTTPVANDKAEYGLKQITAKLQHHRDELSYTRLYAPFDGYVDKHLQEVHETVAAGQPVISVIGDKQPEAEINLPASEYIRKANFKQYYCTLDMYEGVTYPLELLYILPKANANELYTMRLKIITPENQKQPTPGMNATVSICCGEAEGDFPYEVPSTALLNENGETCVFVFRNGKVIKTDVTVVKLLADGRAVVRCDSLKAGDLVVSAGVHHISDGQSVELAPEISDSNVGGLL